MNRIAILASGNGSNAEAIIRRARELNDVEVVVTIVDRSSAGVSERCQKLKQKCLFVDRRRFSSSAEHELAVLDILKSESIDWIFLCGYKRILSHDFILTWSSRCGSSSRIVNIHPSLLPELPGLNSLKRAWDMRLERTGVTLHYVDEGVDTGAIIEQQDLIIDYSKSFADLEQKTHELEHEIYLRFLTKLSKGRTGPTPELAAFSKSMEVGDK